MDPFGEQQPKNTDDKTFYNYNLQLKSDPIKLHPLLKPSLAHFWLLLDGSP